MQAKCNWLSAINHIGPQAGEKIVDGDDARFLGSDEGYVNVVETTY